MVNTDIGDAHAPTTFVAPVSGGHTGYPFQVNLPASTPDLPKASHVELDQIRAVDIQARIIDQLGRVSASKMEKVDDAPRISLGL